MTIRVVFIITGLSTGGAETMLVRLLEHIDRSRFTSHVISLTGKGEFGSRIEALGVPVEALGMRPGMFSFTLFMRLVFRLRALKPHVVHTWMYHADLLGGLAARLAGIRRVGWALHNSDLDPDKSKRATRIVMRACVLASACVPRRILSCSERARSVHVAAGYSAEKIVVVPNGFDLDRFRPDPEARRSVRIELGAGDDAVLIGLVARNDPQKNHMGFIDAARRVHERVLDVHFVLVGSGVDPDNAVLMQAIERAGLRKVFHLLGRREDVPRLMASLDIACSSSYGEAFPLVIGEAMACGVPCVVTDAGDSADIVGDTGRVVPVGDMAGLASELVALLGMPATQRQALGRKARERVRERYEIGGVVRQYESFYLSLLDTNGTCAA